MPLRWSERANPKFIKHYVGPQPHLFLNTLSTVFPIILDSCATAEYQYSSPVSPMCTKVNTASNSMDNCIILIYSLLLGSLWNKQSGAEIVSAEGVDSDANYLQLLELLIKKLIIMYPLELSHSCCALIGCLNFRPHDYWLMMRGHPLSEYSIQCSKIVFTTPLEYQLMAHFGSIWLFFC